MSIRPFLQLLKQKKLGAVIRTNALYKPFYRLTCLAALRDSGLMDRLDGEAVSFDALASEYAPGAKAEEALQAWLQMGCRLGLIRHDECGYALKGLAKKLARPENDATLALAQEAASMHHELIAKTPAALRAGGLWDLDNQDAALTTRSSRVLEPFQLEALRRFVPQSGACHVLEVGCGSAIYIRHAARRNAQLTAIGLELQSDAAEVARDNIRKWGLRERVSIETGDVRARPVAPDFDLVTLYNNIYYFPVAERIALLAKLRQHLKPGGALLLTTCCQGGNFGMEALNLWGASNRHGGRLPEVREMVEQLHQAGYASVVTMRLIPGDGFYAFHAR